MSKLMMVKPNFVVSMARELWVSSAKEIFAIDGVIEHKLLSSESEGVEKIIRVAPPIRSSGADVRQDRDYIESIHEAFLEVVIERLVEIHGKNRSNFFWRKAISKSLLRHISLCFDMFKASQKNFNPKIFSANLLPSSLFFTPNDFNEHRNYFQDSDLGREQLFSVYSELVHPGVNKFKVIRSLQINHAENQAPFNKKTNISRLRNILSEIKSSAIDFVLKKTKKSKTKILIIDTSIGDQDLRELYDKSSGLIEKNDLPNLNFDKVVVKASVREYFARSSEKLDDFGNYCLKVLEYGMPKIFIEAFTMTYKKYDNFFEDYYPNISYVVCEWWIGFTTSSFAMAVLKERGVSHISLEHNYVSHIFEGVPTKFFYPLVDEYLTLGWEDNLNPTVKPGGSFYAWTEAFTSSQRPIDCLVVLAAPIAYLPEISPIYGFNGQLGVSLYVEMINAFFRTLDSEIVSRITIRGYPQREGEKWMVWDQSKLFYEHICRARAYSDDAGVSSKNLLRQSKIVVVTYLSTVHLEAFMANIPTIVLWNKEAYGLDELHQDYFKDLLEVGICHTDWSTAAIFLREHIDNPDIWWMSEATQNAKNKFLNQNIRPSSSLKQILLDMLH